MGLLRAHTTSRATERELQPDRNLTSVSLGASPRTTRRQTLTVMFVDIRGSSRIEETLSPERTVEFLSLYLGLAAQAIVANNGAVSQFIGDGVLAVFGLLDETDYGASHALAAAAAIHRAFEDVQTMPGSPERVRAVVAFHTGTTLVEVRNRGGNSPHNIFGSAINIASRLEAEAKELELATVMSGSSVAALHGQAPELHLVTRKKLRGISRPVEIWSPDHVGGSESPRARVAIATAARPTAEPTSSIDWRPLAAGAFVASTITVSLLATVWLRSSEARFTSTLMNMAQVAVALAAVFTCGWRANQSQGRLRRGWALIAASSAAWALGQTQADVLGLGVGIMPATAWFADTSFLLSLALAIAGVLCFWTSPLGPFGFVRAVLDGLVVSTSLTFALGALGIDPAALPSQPSEVTDATLFAAGEIVLATVVILLINRGARHLQAPLLVLLGSVAIGGTAAVVGAYEGAASGTRGYGADVILFISLVLVALAALIPVQAPAVDDADGPDVWQLALPWMAVVLAAATAIARVAQGEGLFPFLSLLGAILAGLLGASQFLSHRDSLIALRISRRSEKTLADIVSRSPFGIARVSKECKILGANPSLGSILRETTDSLTGSAMSRYLSTAAQSQVRQDFEGLASGVHEVAESEVQAIRADGDSVWVHLTSTAIKTGTGHVDYFLAMVQDTSARHTADEESRATLAELHRLNQVKADFLQLISHEFKTALIGIEGFSELVLEGSDFDPDEVKESAREIHGGAERLSQMITEFLDVSQAENAPAPILVQPVDINRVICGELDEIKRGTDGLTFTTVLDSDLPVFFGDESQMSQLVGVLLQNAVKYSPDGGSVTVTTRTHLNQLEISVTDQGVGRRADFDNPVFGGDDLYARNPIRLVVGTGLGLGMAREIVAGHGGRIWMDRLDGVGSQANVTLPLVGALPPADAKLRAASTLAS